MFQVVIESAKLIGSLKNGNEARYWKNCFKEEKRSEVILWTGKYFIFENNPNYDSEDMKINYGDRSGGCYLYYVKIVEDDVEEITEMILDDEDLDEKEFFVLRSAYLQHFRSIFV
jgi:hypothetical protein